MFGGVDLFTIFVTGLLAGGLACVAVQGGLLTSLMAQQSVEVKDKGKILSLAAFLIAKLTVYTILGFFLGWFGSIIDLSIQARIILQLIVVVFMLGIAGNLLKIHPLFRYFVIQPPRFLSRLVRGQAKQADRGRFFAPVVLGAFTIFIPCGVTQAMMLLAVSSGNALIGAAILFAFVLGTSPLFFLLGYMTMKLGEVLQRRFVKLAAVAIILLALFNLDTAVALTGTQYTARNMLNEGFCLVSYCSSPAVGPELAEGVTEQTIEITSSGYSPNYFAVKARSTVTLHLVNKGAVGCTQVFTIPSLNIQKITLPNSSSDLVFTAPSKPGKISFMCSMGMYPGTIEVL